MIRWFVVALAAIPVGMLGVGLADVIGLPPVYGVLPVLLLLAWAAAPWLVARLGVRERDSTDAFRDSLWERGEVRRASSKDPGLRPNPRTTGADPLDPLIGALAEFPANPDEGQDDAHHLFVDPDDLRPPVNVTPRQPPDGERR